MQEPGHPMIAALVKEFGVYPPGCHVRLASGETAVVLKRGPTITTPVVAAMCDAHGVAYPQPIRRDTARASHAIQAVLGGVRPSAKESARIQLQVALA